MTRNDWICLVSGDRQVDVPLSSIRAVEQSGQQVAVHCHGLPELVWVFLFPDASGARQAKEAWMDRVRRATA